MHHRGVVVSSSCAFARTFMKTQGDAEAERQVDATLLAVNDAFGCGCVIAHLTSGGVHPFARVRTCKRSFACGVKADARLSARVCHHGRGYFARSALRLSSAVVAAASTWT